MLKAFRKYIESKSILNKHDKTLLAVSGGIDSMVMLDLFKQAGYYFEVAHCNFLLRGKASNEDELFVIDYCKNNNIICHHIRFETTLISKQNKKSIEETARELRYKWFSEIALKNNLQYIATGHHKNDVTESMLINLSRGTGISGLHGILPKRNSIIRPMLFASKSDIEKYAIQHNIEFVYDQTNSENEYVRNKFRNEIIPMFTNINPDFINTTNRVAAHIKETEDLLTFFIEEIRNSTFKNTSNTLCIDLSKIDTKILSKTLLFELIKAYGFNSSQTSDIFGSISKSGKIFYSNNHKLIVDRTNLLIEAYPSNPSKNNSFIIETLPNTIEIEGQIYVFELLDRNDISASDLKNKNTQYIDFDLVKLPLLIQRPKEGERLSPFGLQGTKKISDYITDKKISYTKKSQILGIYANKIIGLLGIEIDNKFAIKNNTKTALRISAIQNQ